MKRRRLGLLIPRMFHRRLVLLVLLACATTVVLALQTTNLTLAQGAALRRRAESLLVKSRTIATYRGSILDRRHRVLAFDRPSYDVRVDFDLLTGQWAYRQAYAQARRDPHWKEADARRRMALTASCQQGYDLQIRQLWQTLSQLTATSPQHIEQRRTAIIQRVHSYMLSYWRRVLAQWRRTFDRPPQLRDVAKRQVQEQQMAHVLIEDVDDRVRFAIERMKRSADQPSVWNDVLITFETERDQPWRTVAVELDASTLPSPLKREGSLSITVHEVGTHVVGKMRRKVLPDQLAANPYAKYLASGERAYDLKGYQEGDSAGLAGIERSMEWWLRGTRGRTTTRWNGQPGPRTDPVPGQDVVATIDIALQARVQAIMDPVVHGGTGLMRAQPWHKRPQNRRGKPLAHPVRDGEPLCGAAIVVEVESGQVLAAVSAPWQRPEHVSDSTAEARRWDLINDPWRNRVVAKPYPPGSTVKPLLLAAVYSEGRLAGQETLPCAPGYLYEHDPDRFQCWRYKHYGIHHEPLDGPHAIMRSCNMFFYQVGQRLGWRGVRRWLSGFGVGHSLPCGLLEQIATSGATGIGKKQAALMGIGQGPVDWTLLQAATAYATLARGGMAMPVTFIDRPVRGASTVHDLGLDVQGVAQAMQGLHLAANHPQGTAHHLNIVVGQPEPIFNIEGVQLYAKSGTADAPDLRVLLPDEQGQMVRQTVRQGDHGWMICLVRREGSPRPDYVVAAVVEFGGSGGHVAGPIVNQILHAMRDEGYM